MQTYKLIELWNKGDKEKEYANTVKLFIQFIYIDLLTYIVQYTLLMLYPLKADIQMSIENCYIYKRRNNRLKNIKLSQLL